MFVHFLQLTGAYLESCSMWKIKGAISASHFIRILHVIWLSILLDTFRSKDFSGGKSISDIQQRARYICLVCRVRRWTLEKARLSTWSWKWASPAGGIASRWICPRAGVSCRVRRRRRSNEMRHFFYTRSFDSQIHIALTLSYLGNQIVFEYLNSWQLSKQMSSFFPSAIFTLFVLKNVCFFWAQWNVIICILNEMKISIVNDAVAKHERHVTYALKEGSL